MTEANRHQDLLKECIERGADYFLIFRDKKGKIQICYSHDYDDNFKKEVFDMIREK